MSVVDDRHFLERSIADLDAEHDAGDLSDRDWQRLRASYTARLAALDTPTVADEAAIVDEPAPAGPDEPVPGEPAAPVDPAIVRRRRRLYATAGVLVVALAALAGLAVRSSGTRLPSGVATGSAVGAERTGQLLAAAAAATAKGDQVSAIEDYEAVLKTDPNQVVALTQEGWILAQTQQPDLLKQGIGLFGKALAAEPGYPPALVYRGIAELTEGDDADSVTDLQAYLAGSPDPALVAKVQSALASAKAGLARQQAAPTTTAPAGAGGGTPAG